MSTWGTENSSLGSPWRGKSWGDMRGREEDPGPVCTLKGDKLQTPKTRASCDLVPYRSALCMLASCRWDKCKLGVLKVAFSDPPGVRAPNSEPLFSLVTGANKIGSLWMGILREIFILRRFGSKIIKFYLHILFFVSKKIIMDGRIFNYYFFIPPCHHWPLKLYGHNLQST